MNGPRGLWASVALSLAASTSYVVITGYFTIRANALASGAIVGWGLHLEAVTQARSPVMQQAAILLASALLAYPYARCVATGRRADRAAVAGPPAAAATIMVGLAGWALTTTEHPHQGGVDPTEPVIVAVLREAGLSSAVHATAGVLLMLALFALTRDPTDEHDAASTTPE